VCEIREQNQNDNQMKCPLTFVGDLKDTNRDIEMILYKKNKTDKNVDEII